MIEAGWGRIVNISSSSTHSGAPYMAPYVAAKSAVNGLTKTLALEYGPNGITVNAVPPGFIDTPMLRAAADKGFLGDIDKTIAATPVRRIGKPEDIAAACAFLVSEEAGYITGQILGRQRRTQHLSRTHNTAKGHPVGRVEGKVAFVTGAGARAGPQPRGPARRRGRRHHRRRHLCDDIDTIGYPMATPEDLDETAQFVEKTGRASVTAQADVARGRQLQAALDDGLAEFGKLDIVVAQAGIAGDEGRTADLQAWIDVINTNLIGTINAIQVALPHLKEGASIIATGSTAALMDVAKKRQPRHRSRRCGYLHSKRLLSEYVHDLATELAPRGIRANVVHPTNCNTDMLQSEPMYRSFRPDLENPTRADAEPVFGVQQAMKVPYIEPEDISNMVLFLASDEARYVTGMQMRVDAGGYLKWYDYHI